MRLLLLLLCVVLTVIGSFAQQGATLRQPEVLTTVVTEPDYPITHSDLYCSGFLSKPMTVKNFVAGGLHSPVQTRFAAGDYIFVRGHDYEPGMRVSIIRQLRDPNRLDPIPGARKLAQSAGQIYSDLGYAVIVQQRKTDIAIARVEFACDEIVDGDQVMPFVTREPVTYRVHSSLDRFPVDPSSVTGRIVGSREFDDYLGTGQKVYLNLGERQGLKAGDYFRVVRGYRRGDLDVVDKFMRNAPASDDSQRIAPRLSTGELGDLPRHVVGELIVLNTRPTTATAMVTFALQEIHVGDTVQLEPNTADPAPVVASAADTSGPPPEAAPDTSGRPPEASRYLQPRKWWNGLLRRP